MNHKKKIGLIDHYIDEWHACNYPDMIARSRYGRDFEVAYAWEQAPAPGKRPLAAWCGDMGLVPCASIEETVARSDALFILAPTAPEHHERLAEAALKSGKPVYIDKPFCDTAAGAERMFALADLYGTPLTGFSALRFSASFTAMADGWRAAPPRFATARGGGAEGGFRNYGIHPVTMLAMCMGRGARRVMQLFGHGSGVDALMVEYPGGRRGVVTRTPQSPFELTGAGAEEFSVRASENFFESSMDEVLRFFSGGPEPLGRAEILEAVRIYEAGLAAQASPGVWVDVPGARMSNRISGKRALAGAHGGRR